MGLRYSLTSGLAIAAMFVGSFIPALMSIPDIIDGLRRGRGTAGLALGWGVLFSLAQAGAVAYVLWNGFDLVTAVPGLVVPAAAATPPAG